MKRWIRYSDHVLAWAESALVLPRLCGLCQWKRTTVCYNDLLFNRYKDRQIPILKLFMTWFREQLPVTYENYKLARQSDPTRQDTKKYHTKVKNHFSICKTASCPCCCKKLDRYPAFEDNLEALANQALDKKQTRKLSKKSVFFVCCFFHQIPVASCTW